MNQFPTSQFELGTFLIKELSDVSFVGDRKILGTAPVSWDLNKLEDSLSNTFLFIDEIGSVDRKVTFMYPSFFFDEIDELFKKEDYFAKLPEKFYLVPENYFFPCSKEIEIVSKYKSAVQLISVLIDIADYAVPTNAPDKLVFFSRGRLEIDISYKVDQLNDFTNLDMFIKEYVQSDIHTENKHRIIGSVLTEFYSEKPRVSIGQLLKRFQDFYEAVQKSYELYVSEFSFEKVKSEIVKEKLDGVVKLNKVFSDIQNQLLAVPIAIILVGGQLKNTGELDTKNILIWCGALVFTIFMNLLIRNQKHTLASVKDEIDQQRRFSR